MSSATLRLMFGMTLVALLAVGFSGTAGALEGDVYTLKTCPVSGKELGDSPVIKEIDNREVRFCCEGCPSKYEADTAKYNAKIDEAIKAEQAEDYPLTTCVMSGEPLGDSPNVFVYNNRLVKTCCERCEKAFMKDAEANLAKLDAAVIEAQKDSYPLKTCVVSGEELGSMGEPVELVINNQLVKLCCAGCKKPVAKEPLKYLSKIEEGE